MQPEKILITGTAGFIGFHLAQRLLADGYQVVGLDNINDYYDINLKYSRLEVTGISRGAIVKKPLLHDQIQESRSKPGSLNINAIMVQSSVFPEYRFIRADLMEAGFLKRLFASEGFDYVVHLAAQAGVRYSLTNPQVYIDSNITGTLNLLEACRAFPVKHLVYASSSSVYGMNTQMPFSVSQGVDHPVSLYGVSKKTNELMAHTYSHLFGVPSTGLRFFTAYGPWGRPDMALFIFTRAILAGEPINVFNHGNMMRDFTYIDDLVEGIMRIMKNPATPNKGWNSSQPDPASSLAPFRIYNIGNNSPVRLMDFVNALENELGRKAIINLLPLQPGDVPATWADTSALEQHFDYKPATPVQLGIKRFVEWYLKYYG
ncbi:MAG TPA: NAD-dependent epimerase [Bacteroidales bacterium]|nr:NAD-dependent epimerase [Bacteroidales bacterium]